MLPRLLTGAGLMSAHYGVVTIANKRVTNAAGAATLPPCSGWRSGGLIDEPLRQIQTPYCALIAALAPVRSSDDSSGSVALTDRASATLPIIVEMIAAACFLA